jgi:hypothetical protein
MYKPIAAIIATPAIQKQLAYDPPADNTPAITAAPPA